MKSHAELDDALWKVCAFLVGVILGILATLLKFGLI